jgi:regulator of nucleoside diphosphate kinase
LNPSCRLTTKDYAILETMLERCREPGSAYAKLLRRKLSGAGIWLSADIPPDVVTINSRVLFRANDGPAQTRIVAQSAVRGVVGMLLPVTTLRGLALLGLAGGESIEIDPPDAPATVLTVVEVIYQPEAAHREAQRLNASPVRPSLRLVYSAATPVDAMAEDRNDDDPGPSAA